MIFLIYAYEYVLFGCAFELFYAYKYKSNYLIHLKYFILMLHITFKVHSINFECQIFTICFLYYFMRFTDPKELFI